MYVFQFQYYISIIKSLGLLQFMNLEMKCTGHVECLAGWNEELAVTFEKNCRPGKNVHDLTVFFIKLIY